MSEREGVSPTKKPTAEQTSDFRNLKLDSPLGNLVRSLLKSDFLSADEFQKLPDALKTVCNSYFALEQAMNNFTKLDSHLPLHKRTEKEGFTDHEQRLRYASSVVKERVEALWNDLLRLPDSIMNNLTNRNVNDAPGGWNEAKLFGTNPFGITQEGDLWISETYRNSDRQFYSLDPEGTISLAGKAKNPVLSAIAYLQNIRARAESIANDARDDSLPPLTTLKENLCSMVFDYILKAKDQPPQIAARRWRN